MWVQLIKRDQREMMETKGTMARHTLQEAHGERSLIALSKDEAGINKA